MVLRAAVPWPQSVSSSPSGSKNDRRMRGEARSPARSMAVALAAVPLLISAVLAIGVQVQPGNITDGSQISISLSNVTDGYILNTTVIAGFTPVTSPSWFNITNWRYSFGLGNGNVTVIGQNVNRIRLLVRAGTSLRTAENTGTGNIYLAIPMDILPELYYDYRVLYEVHDPDLPITLAVIQQGSKAGPDESQFDPSIYGVKEGNLTVEESTNGILQASRVIRVGVFPETPVPTTAVPGGTRSPTPTTPETTVSGTPTPASPRPTAPRSPPPTTPSPTSSPAPEGGLGGPALVLLGFVAVIVIIAVVADYFLLRD